MIDYIFHLVSTYLKLPEEFKNRLRQLVPYNLSDLPKMDSTTEDWEDKLVISFQPDDSNIKYSVIIQKHEGLHLVEENHILVTEQLETGEKE